MVISSFISSILILALGIWAYMRLESSMNIVAEKQLLIEPSKFSYKMWKEMPVTMYQSFTFFNLTNWNQVKSVGQKPRFVEVGPYVYRTIWSKSDINFMDEERLVSFSEKKQWIFQPQLSRGQEDDQIWTINTPLMTALALIQNAPVITRNIVSVILDGLGEGAFIKRNIRSLLFEGYSDLIVSVGPLFDRRFSNFNGKFAYLYNKNDSVDGIWTVSTGTEDLAQLNKITRFQSGIVNMTSFSSGQLPQGLNEVKPECAPAWSLDQATNGQLFAPFNQDVERAKLEQQLAQLRARAQRAASTTATSAGSERIARSESATSTQLQQQAPVAPKRFFSRSAASHDTSSHRDHHNHNYHHNNHHNHNHHHHSTHSQQQVDGLVPNPFLNQRLPFDPSGHSLDRSSSSAQQISPTAGGEKAATLLRDVGKFIFYPDLCRPIHLLAGKQEVSSLNGIRASRYYIDPRVFMNSTQVPTNKCYEMNPRPALANALAATINSVTGANVAMPNLVTGASSPFAMFAPPSSHHHGHEGPTGSSLGAGLFERSNHPASFLNNALHGFGANLNVGGQATGSGSGGAGVQDQQTSSSNQAPVSRLGRVRQLFSNIMSQRMSAASPGSLLPSLASVPANILMGGHFPGGSQSRNAPDDPAATQSARQAALAGAEQVRHAHDALLQGSNPVPLAQSVHPLAAGQPVAPPPAPSGPAGGSDRWITQFRFKWPRGVFSIGQCQLGAPIYASLPHFLDADEYYLEQVDGLKPNRSLHEFYIDIESTLHSVPVNAKARLQLNVATPELRFRNIPNAMIPVLWQEVTFEIDKPIASMLYWSFTMSSTIYKLISLLLLATGLILMAASFVGGFKQHRRRARVAADGRQHSGARSISGGSGSCSSRSSSSSSSSEGRRRTRAPTTMRRADGSQRSSWLPHILSRPTGSNVALARSLDAHTSKGETLRELGHGAALNHAFSSCTEFHDRLQVGDLKTSGLKSGSGGAIIAAAGSPKQPSSRTSSQCELISSLGAQVNCAGCLLACLRHSPNSVASGAGSHLASQPAATSACAINQQQHQHSSNVHDHCLAVGSMGDNSLVRQQQQQIVTSDIDKATLSSRESNLDSCSSIYPVTQQRHSISTFK